MDTSGIDKPSGTTGIASCPIERVKINDLKFDLNNIRLSHLKIKNVQDLEKKLEEIGNIEQLKNRIISAKTVFEPLIVNSKYTVLEGNRRLAACRSIIKEWQDNPAQFNNNYPGLDPKQFSELRCKVLSENIDTTAIAIYLISTHMRVKKPWQLFNRAIYLYKLYNDYKWTYDEIASQGFMSKATAIKTVICYKYTMNYKKKYGHEDDSWSKKYIYFWQLLTNKNLSKFKNDDVNVEKFTSWIGDKKFKNHTQIKDLPHILNDHDAKKIFFKSSSKHSPGLSYRRALEVLKKNDPAVTDKTFKSIKKMIISIQDLTRHDITNICKNSRKKNYILELKIEISQLYADVKNASERLDNLNMK